MRTVRLDLGDKPPENLRRIFALEPYDGDWLNNNTWGNSYRGLMPGGAGIAQGVAELIRTPGPPRVYSCQLFRDDNRDHANADVRAKVTYGIGGVRNSFYLDWIAGCQFSLVASYIKVDFETYRPDENAAYSTGTTALQLGCTFGAGTIGHGPYLSYTTAISTIANSTNKNYPVPDFARAFRVQLTNNDDPSTPTLVRARAQSGATLNVDCNIFAGGSAAAVQGYPIPGGLKVLNVANASGSAQFPQVQWFLSL